MKLKCCCLSIKNNNLFLSVGPVMSLMCLCFLHSPLRDTYNYISFLCLSFSLMLPPPSVLIVLGKRKCLYICICCCASITTDVLFVIISYSVYGHACCSKLTCQSNQLTQPSERFTTCQQNKCFVFLSALWM